VDEHQPPRGEPAVALRSVTVGFGSNGRAPVRVLTGLSLVVERGQLVALVGASGCGKTTVLDLVAGLVGPSSGEAAVLGEPPRVGRRDVGYMFARDALLPWRTARQNVELGLEVQGWGRRARRDLAERLLGRVDLSSVLDRYPSELSQGMRQRVALARTLATDPAVLLMDEPFAALDAQTRASVRSVFLDIWGDELDRKTVLFVTHDLAEALLVADRVVVIAGGRVQVDIEVPWSRPRHERSLFRRPDYSALYDTLHAHLRPGT
jgi:NitT/TauT family transport system ATP-binding protein